MYWTKQTQWSYMFAKIIEVWGCGFSMKPSAHLNTFHQCGATLCVGDTGLICNKLYLAPMSIFWKTNWFKTFINGDRQLYNFPETVNRHRKIYKSINGNIAIDLLVMESLQMFFTRPCSPTSTNVSSLWSESPGSPVSGLRISKVPPVDILYGYTSFLNH